MSGIFDKPAMVTLSGKRHFPDLSPRDPAATPLASERPFSSRRRRLWELPKKYHCPVIGVCFDVGELRRMISKELDYPPQTTDYVWHTIAVGVCTDRCRLSEQFNKVLDKRYQLMIRRFAACKTVEELRAEWHDVCRQGCEIPAELWAACTHPVCSGELEREIHGDIHMIQHQVGAGARLDLKAMKDLQAENGELQRQMDALRSRNDQQREEHLWVTQELSQRLLEAQTSLASRESSGKRLQAELDSLRAQMPDIQDRQRLALRLQDAETEVRLLRSRERELLKEIEKLGDLARSAEQSVERQTVRVGVESCGDVCPSVAEKSISGKSVLCVGGRSSSISAYHQVVEEGGGRFMHHDGGLEENLHRIDGALAAADIVICQVGCISHNAYWRVKELCKRTGKPCMFLRNSGLASFGRVVGEASRLSDKSVE